MAAPKDGVHLQKYEDTASGGDDADQADAFAATEPLEPWEDAPYVQGFFLQAPSATPVDSTTFDKLVYVTRDAGGNLIFRDVVDGTERTLSDLLTGGAGLTESGHRTLRQLIHFIDNGPAEGFASGAFAVQAPATAFPTSKIWYVVGSTPPAGKIVEQTVTYNANKTINTSEWKMYDTDGSTVLVTVTDTFSYSGVFSTGETRTIV